MDWKTLIKVAFKEFADTSIPPDMYRRIVQEDLANKYPEHFDVRATVCGGPTLYMGATVVEDGRVRIPIMKDSYDTFRRRKAIDMLGRTVGEPDLSVRGPESLGCDYILNLEGTILESPSREQLKKSNKELKFL
jgi:hypothetical protein